MRITSAKALPDFQMQLEFDNRESGIVDLSALAGKGVFAAWDVPGVVESVAITDEGAVAWPGEIDLCPDSLYMQMTGKRPEEVFPALQARTSNA